MLFDNRWNQHTCTSLTLLPFGLWAPGSKYKDIFGKLRIEIKQHIKDGIPLPLNTVNRLNRLVTVR